MTCSGLRQSRLARLLRSTPTPDAPDSSTPSLDPRRSATLAQIRGRGRGKKHKILKLWGIHLLLVTIYTPIDPGFGYHKSRKPGPKRTSNLDLQAQIWTHLQERIWGPNYNLSYNISTTEVPRIITEVQRTTPSYLHLPYHTFYPIYPSYLLPPVPPDSSEPIS